MGSGAEAVILPGSTAMESDDTPDTRSFPSDRGSLDRAGDDRRVPRRSGSAAPLSRTNLSRSLLLIASLHSAGEIHALQ
jgi:hypothetical protein